MNPLKYLVAALIFGSAFGQDNSDFAKGLGLEIGTGYSEMFWSGETAWGEFSLTDFSLSPEIRVFYRLNVINDFFIHAFAGFQQIKGIGVEPVWFYECNQKYKLDRAFIGSNFLYHFTKINFYSGIGLKLFRVNSATLESNTNDPSYPLSLEKQDLKNTYNEFSLDIGIVANYEVLNFLFSLEGWFAITNLYKIPDYGLLEIGTRNLTIHENHFRLLVGHKL